MQKKLFVTLFIVVMFLLICFSIFYIYKQNKDKYYEKIVNNIDTIYNKNKNVNSKDKYVTNIYSFFIKNNQLKKELTGYKYEIFTKNNNISEIYNENNDILINLQKNINQMNLKKEEINKNFTYEKFLSILKQDKELILKKIDRKIFDSNKVSVNNIVETELKKYNELKEFINNVAENKSKWNKKNEIIIADTDEYKKYLEENNSKFGITITVNKKVILTSWAIPIFMYHAVNDETWGITSLFQKIKDFEREMKYLNDNGYRTIFLSDIKNHINEKKTVILTFDDGYEDFYRIAYPIMKKYNIKSNLFVISGSDGEKYVTKSQIKELSDSNLVEIGSHTVTHPDLRSLSEEALASELRESKITLEKIINKKVTTFAYPMGYYNDKVVTGTGKYYDYALVMGGGIQYITNNTNYLKLKRVSMYRGASLEYFIGKL